MTTRPRFTVGDRIIIRGVVQVQTSDDVAPAADEITGATFKGALVKYDRTALATGTSVIDGTVIDVPTALVEFVFPSSQTGTIEPGAYFVEMQMTKGGEPVTLERLTIEIEKGLIP